MIPNVCQYIVSCVNRYSANDDWKSSNINLWQERDRDRNADNLHSFDGFAIILSKSPMLVFTPYGTAHFKYV